MRFAANLNNISIQLNAENVLCIWHTHSVEIARWTNVFFFGKIVSLFYFFFVCLVNISCMLHVCIAMKWKAKLRFEYGSIQPISFSIWIFMLHIRVVSSCNVNQCKCVKSILIRFTKDHFHASATSTTACHPSIWRMKKHHSNWMSDNNEINNLSLFRNLHQ